MRARRTPIHAQAFNLLSSDFDNRCVLLCSASGRTDPERVTRDRGILHSLLSPEPIVPEKQRRGLVYYPASRSGYSMPDDPLALCCYDVVLLTDGSLNQLEQLQALLRWTEVGGSLCIVPTGKGLSGRHLEFLCALLPGDADGPLLTDEGTITLVSGEAGICAEYTGLGRCVLLPHGIDPVADISVDERVWIRDFLWRARGSKLPADEEEFSTVRRHSTTLRESTKHADPRSDALIRDTQTSGIWFWPVV